MVLRSFIDRITAGSAGQKLLYWLMRRSVMGPQMYKILFPILFSILL